MFNIIQSLWHSASKVAYLPPQLLLLLGNRPSPQFFYLHSFCWQMLKHYICQHHQHLWVAGISQGKPKKSIVCFIVFLWFFFYFSFLYKIFCGKNEEVFIFSLNIFFVLPSFFCTISSPPIQTLFVVFLFGVVVENKYTKI